MPSKKLPITRLQTRRALHWAVLALVGVPLFFVPRLLVPGGPDSGAWLPRDIARSVVGIVEAVTPGGPPAAAKPSQTAQRSAARPSHGQHVRAAAAAAGAHTLIPVVSAACTSCRVLRDSATGGLRVTLGAAQRTAPGSAFALLDFGGLGGAGGVVRVHDRIGLDRGDVPQSDLSVLQVTDIENRVAYRLQIDRLTRVLRLVSPPGGLSRSSCR